MLTTRIVLFLLLCALTVAVAPAQEFPVGTVLTDDEFKSLIIKDNIERFKLFTECEKMGLAVVLTSVASKASNGIELSEEAIRKVAKNRLRIARLYTTSRYWNRVTVGVTIVGAAVAVIVSFNKLLLCPVTKEVWEATTWTTGHVGAHGGDADYVISHVSKNLDKFLVEYLRVNNKACVKD